MNIPQESGSGLALFVAVVAVLVLIELVKTVRHRRTAGNTAYRDRVDAIIDDALPREDAPAKWRAYRAEERQ